MAIINGLGNDVGATWEQAASLFSDFRPILRRLMVLGSVHPNLRTHHTGYTRTYTSLYDKMDELARAQYVGLNDVLPFDAWLDSRTAYEHGLLVDSALDYFKGAIDERTSDGKGFYNWFIIWLSDSFYATLREAWEPMAASEDFAEWVFMEGYPNA